MCKQAIDRYVLLHALYNSLFYLLDKSLKFIYNHVHEPIFIMNNVCNTIYCSMVIHINTQILISVYNIIVYNNINIFRS